VLAGEALARGGSAAAGKAFFVNDAEPVVVWDWINQVLEGVGVAPVTRRVPAGVAYAVGAACEGVWRLFALAGEPPMTRFVARQLSTSHTYSLQPSRDAFGFEPRVVPCVALQRTIDWLSAGKQ
jgi:hypothetical protein